MTRHHHPFATDRGSRTPARAGLAPLLFFATSGGPAWAQGDSLEYQGPGYVTDSGLQAAALQAELLDLDGDGLLDLASLDVDGRLAVSRGFAAYREVASIDAGVVGIAVTRTGDSDRLWAVSAVDVHPVSWADVVAGALPAGRGIGTVAPGAVRAQARSGASFVSLIDQGGSRARVFDVDAEGTWSLWFQRSAPAEQYLDISVVDWNGNEDAVAIATGSALVVRAAGGALIQEVAGLPDPTLLAVLDGGRTQWGEDLLHWQSRFSEGWPLTVLVANQVHSELLYTEGVGLRSLAFAGFLGEPTPQLVLTHGTARMATLAKQVPTNDATEAIWGLDPSETTWVNLVPPNQDPGTPDRPPALALGDLDQDGDEDMVFVDDAGNAFVVLSETVDADVYRAFEVPVDGSPVLEVDDDARFVYPIFLSVPEGVAEVDWEVWYLPEEAIAVDPAPIAGGRAPADQMLDLDVLLPSPSPHATIQLLLRPVAERDPSSVSYWIPDPVEFGFMAAETPAIYKWTPPPITSGGAGGTTRRPQIGPLPKPTSVE